MGNLRMSRFSFIFILFVPIFWGFRVGRHATCTSINKASGSRAMVQYPFHIAKCAVTPHWTPLLIHPLCCCYTPVCYSHRVSDFSIMENAVKNGIKHRAEPHQSPQMHWLAFPWWIIRCTLSHWPLEPSHTAAFGLEYATKTPLESTSSTCPRRTAQFLTTGIN